MAAAAIDAGRRAWWLPACDPATLASYLLRTVRDRDDAG